MLCPLFLFFLKVTSFRTKPQKLMITFKGKSYLNVAPKCCSYILVSLFVKCDLYDFTNRCEMPFTF